MQSLLSILYRYRVYIDTSIVYGYISHSTNKANTTTQYKEQYQCNDNNKYRADNSYPIHT